jgi:hypothetical protein
MKLVALTPDMHAQLSTLLEEARPGQLWLEAPALAELRASLNGPGFVPRVYVGVQGGLIQGATGNCAMQLVGGDYDTEGSAEHEQRYLRPFGSTAVIVEHAVVNDPATCTTLFADALADAETAEEQPSESMTQ